MMTIFKTQTVDLVISHSQIALSDKSTYSKNCDDKDRCRWEWGDLNVEQGAVLHPDCLTFDPLPDGTFDAFVHLSVADSFVLDKDAKRAIFAPLKVNNPDELEIGSAFSHFKVELDLKLGFYHAYFEICEDFDKNIEEEDKLFFKFTLIKQAGPANIIRPYYLCNDPWGGKKGKELVIGKADRPFTMKIGRMQRYLHSLGISISKSSQIFIFTDLSEEERSNIKRSIGWHPVGGCHCIAYDFEPGEGWSVFYAERGGRYDIQTFANEADACYAFIYREA